MVQESGSVLFAKSDFVENIVVVPQVNLKKFLKRFGYFFDSRFPIIKRASSLKGID